MNQSQITAIQERLDVLDKIDIQDKVSVFYKDQANFENSMLSTMTISDFCLSYTDAITKLSNALKTKKSPFLPYNYNFHNEYAHGNLPALLDQILGYINGNDFANAQIQISNLIHYEILNVIFDEPKYPKNSLRIEKINDTEEKLSLLQKQLNMYSKNIESQLDLLTKKSSESYVRKFL